MRSLARKTVFEYIYSRLFNPSDEGLFPVLTAELNEEDKQFAQSLLDGVLKNEEFYADKIGSLATNFRFNRILSVDKCAIMVGMSELDNFPDTPIPVVVDEAVKLSAIFSTEKSTDFVNGILAGYIKDKNNG